MAWIIEESAVLGGADNTIMIKDGNSGLYIAEVFDARDAAILAAAPSLADTLDNVTAALENCLARFGKYMTPADRFGRGNLAREARALADSIMRPEEEEDPEAEERKAARREREKREEARDYHDNVKTREFVGED